MSRAADWVRNGVARGMLWREDRRVGQAGGGPGTAAA